MVFWITRKTKSTRQKAKESLGQNKCDELGKRRRLLGWAWKGKNTNWKCLLWLDQIMSRNQAKEAFWSQLNIVPVGRSICLFRLESSNIPFEQITWPSNSWALSSLQPQLVGSFTKLQTHYISACLSQSLTSYFNSFLKIESYWAFSVLHPYLNGPVIGKPNIFNMTGPGLQIYLSGFYWHFKTMLVTKM